MQGGVAILLVTSYWVSCDGQTHKPLMLEAQLEPIFLCRYCTCLETLFTFCARLGINLTVKNAPNPGSNLDCGTT